MLPLKVAGLCLILVVFVSKNQQVTGLEYEHVLKNAMNVLLKDHSEERPDLRAVIEDDNFEMNLWRLLQRSYSMGQMPGLTDACSTSVTETLNALQTGQYWALSMLDATSKIESGILEGNSLWPGDFGQCLRVNAVKYPDGPTTAATTTTRETTSVTSHTTDVTNRPSEVTSLTPDVTSRNPDDTTHTPDGSSSASQSPDVTGRIPRTTRANADVTSVSQNERRRRAFDGTGSATGPSTDVTSSSTEVTSFTSAPTTSPVKATHLFDGQHCSVVIGNISNPMSIPGAMVPGITVGICIPDTCTQNDSIALVAAVLSQLPQKQIWPFTSNCHTNEGYPLDAAAVGTILMLSVIGVVLLVATLYDIIVVQMNATWPWQNHELPLVDQDASSINGVPPNYSRFGNPEGNDYAAIAEGQRGWLPMLMVRLSMYSNGAKLLNTDRNKGSLDCLHGIRFISMTWVILGHTYAFIVTLVRNPVEFYYSATGFAVQAILNATVSVDTFFLLSGTLVSYLLLKELKKKGTPRHINWAMYYFHRFWRLTPPYMIVLGAHTALFKYLGNGPFWTEQGADPTCPGSWWANFLYLNNLIPDHKACMGWAWYLANDMQFYIISPLFIIALYMNKIVGFVLCSVTVLGSTIAYAVITKVNNYPAEIVDLLSGKGGDWFNDVYITPWCRIGPYIIGLLLGYIIVETDRKVKLKWYINLLGWAVAAGTAVGILYGLYDVANGHPLSSSMAAFYASIHRTLWAVAVAWVIFACVSGLGGPVNGLLSWQGFIPLSRLTYMAYLIHPVVIYGYSMSRKVPFYFDQSTQVWLFLGYLTVTYGLAFVCSLAFESPMMGLEKVIFMKKPNKEQT